MAEFVKKSDGANVKLRRPHRGAVSMSVTDPEGIVGYIKSFATKYEGLSNGHLVSLEIFITDEDLARASGFAPTVYPGAKVKIVLVEDGIPIELKGEPWPGRADSADSDPTSESEHENDYEEDTEGPPPKNPPATEPEPRHDTASGRMFAEDRIRTQVAQELLQLSKILKKKLG